MASVLSEDFHHEVGEAVHDLWLRAAPFGGVDHPHPLPAPPHLVQAPEEASRRPQQVDANCARDLVAVLDGEVPPELAARGRATILFRAVAREEEEVAHL